VKKIVPPLFAIAVSFVAIVPAVAIEPYEEGVKLFQKKSYELSAKEFEKVLIADPKNEKAIYYAGLSCQYLGDSKRALEHYKNLINKFPDSATAKYLKSSLNLTGATTSLTASSSSTAKSKSNDFIPDSDAVSFTYDFHRYKVVKCRLNDAALPMIFDTKSDESSVGKNHLKALGMPLPTGKPTEGSLINGRTQPSWSIPFQVQLGKIRKTINVVVYEKSEFALLARDFFGDMKCTTDYRAGLIRFQKLGVKSEPLPVDAIHVPFIKDGKDILIDVTIGGSPIKMIFESGATTTTMGLEMERIAQQRAWKTLHSINLPEAGGNQKMTIYLIPDIRVGEISHHNLHAMSLSDQKYERGILGQDFFGQRKFFIDEDKRIIHFYRR